MELLVAFLVLGVLGLGAWQISVQMGLSRVQRQLARALGEIERLRRAPASPAQATANDAATEAEPESAPPEPLVEVPAEDAGEASRRMPWEEGYDPAVDRPEEPVAPREPGAGSRFAAWLTQNWFYAVSALSLALAGLFLVQYGIENGYLTPTMRVAAALALGAALVGGGEWIRRRHGDAGATAYLPATFSAAGLVSLYGGVLAARALYGLIGPGPAMAGLVAVSAGALLLGWLNGPVLAGFGLVGAGAAPFLVGGDAGSATVFYVYYGLLGVTGLGIDAWRQWRWVSVLALAVAGAGGAAVYALSGEGPGYAVLVVVLALAAMAIPRREIGPAHDGGAPLAWLVPGLRAPIAFETWLAWGAMLAASLVLLALPRPGAGEMLLHAGLLTLLILAVTVWAWQARALSELVLFPALAFLALIPLESWLSWTLTRPVEVAPGTVEVPGLPLEVSLMMAMAALATAAAAWRGLVAGTGAQGLFWGLFAALFAPLVPLAFELFWLAPREPGGFDWAAHVLALAALMTGIAVRFARADGESRRRAAWAVLSAASLIALALFVILTKSALTVALAVLLALAAALDRRFRLPEMQYFVALGVIVLGWRVVADPGVVWAVEAPWWEFALSFAAPLAAMAAAWRLMPHEGRLTGRGFLESGFLMIAGIFATLALWRFIDARVGDDQVLSHWTLGLTACVWLICAAAQVYRLRLGPRLRWVRIGLAALYGLFALAFLALGLTVSNPFLSVGGASMPPVDVYGPLVFSTLAVGYLLPALALVLIARVGPRRLAPWVLVPAGALVCFWGFLVIRRFWLGDVYVGNGWLDGELYTYTVVLILAGAALLWQAIATGSTALRRAALVVIGVAVVKVLLVDARGLTGLFRVFSFLALGLSLAGLAWLNRWAAQEAAERGLEEE